MHIPSRREEAILSQIDQIPKILAVYRDVKGFQCFFCFFPLFLLPHFVDAAMSAETTELFGSGGLLIHTASGRLPGCGIRPLKR